MRHRFAARTGGFSIVGVLIAAAMMGGLSLFLAQMTKQQHETQKKVETGTEFTQLQQKILTVLYDGDACLATLGAGSVLKNDREIDRLKKPGGRCGGGEGQEDQPFVGGGVDGHRERPGETRERPGRPKWW